LRATKLQNADLARADLNGAKLSESNLTWANLRRADLSWASLSRADFNEADLSDAYLSGTNLSSADLSEANLNGAKLGGANFGGPTSAGPTSVGLTSVGSILEMPSGFQKDRLPLRMETPGRGFRMELPARLTGHPGDVLPKPAVRLACWVMLTPLPPKGLPRNNCFTAVVGWEIWCSSSRRGTHYG
jgi:uncharacterized protein YjbI with pentapeptide repeats